MRLMELPTLDQEGVADVQEYVVRHSTHRLLGVGLVVVVGITAASPGHALSDTTIAYFRPGTSGAGGKPKSLRRAARRGRRARRVSPA